MNVEISHIGLQRAYFLIQKSMVIFVDNACWPMIRRLNPVLWPPWLSFALWRWDHQPLGLKQRWGWMVINPYGELFVLLPEKISWHEPWTPAKLIKHQEFTLYQTLLKKDPHNFLIFLWDLKGDVWFVHFGQTSWYLCIGLGLSCFWNFKAWFVVP